MRHTVLVIGNEETPVALMKSLLEQNGYHVISLEESRRTLEVICSEKPHLIVLETTGVESNGREVCRQIRCEPRTAMTPIILLSTRCEESDIEAGLDAGADEYVTEPFGQRELLARVRAVIRRTGKASSWNALQERSERRTILHWDLAFGSLEMDVEGWQVTYQGQLIDIQGTQFRLLLYLARHRGTVLSLEQLTRHLWGDTQKGHLHSVYRHICWLREKLEPDPKHPQLIQTVRGVGYCMRNRPRRGEEE